jgi:ArsR family transcriptional regulator
VYSDEEIAAVFKALSDKRRIHILKLLQKGETCVCRLQQYCDLGQSGLSYHLKVLSDAGLVCCRQDGKWSHYSLSEKGRDCAVDMLMQLLVTKEDQSVQKC